MSRGSVPFPACTALLLHLFVLLLGSFCSQTSSKSSTTSEILKTVRTYFVKEINYNNFRIRVVDAGVRKIQENYYSKPLYSLSSFNFSHIGDPYTCLVHQEISTSFALDISTRYISVPVIFLDCANPMNSPLFVETAPCDTNKSSYSSSETYSYIVTGFNMSNIISSIRSFDLGESCKVTQMVMTSPSTEKSYMRSCEAIYNEIARGFKISWFYYACRSKCGTSDDSCAFNNKNKLDCYNAWQFNYVQFVFLTFTLISSVCFIPIAEIVAYAAYELLSFTPLDISLKSFNLKLLFFVIAFLGQLQAAKFLFGFPCLTGLLIYKWRRRHLSMYDNIEGICLMPCSKVLLFEYQKDDKRFQRKIG
ncbi:hypothetical protein ABKV19_026472 [Rosa sericea]